MIYLMSQKFWMKHAKKLVKPCDYIGIDGENWSVTGRRSDQEAIATRYSNFASFGSFTPEGRLYGMLRKKKKGEEINESKFAHEIEVWIEDTSFISVAIKTFKSVYGFGIDEPANVFVVIPNLVYKYLAEDIIEAMKDLADMEYSFIFDQGYIKETDYEILDHHLNRRQIKALHEQIKHLEKKYKIVYKKKEYDFE